MRYVALLRGINVGGNNAVPMLQLKQCLEDFGFTDVSTYINSGNVLFESSETDKAKLVQQCERAIEDKFGFRVVCAVIGAAELCDAVAHAPKWWNKDKAAKNNAIFVIAPATAEGVMQEVGEAKPEYEQVAAYGPIILWTAPLETFSRTRYSRIVGAKAYQSVTIRNANTALKLAELCA